MDIALANACWAEVGRPECVVWLLVGCCGLLGPRSGEEGNCAGEVCILLNLGAEGDLALGDVGSIKNPSAEGEGEGVGLFGRSISFSSVSRRSSSLRGVPKLPTGDVGRERDNFG